jgi:hypothetical protein
MCNQWCQWIISVPKLKSPTIYEVSCASAQAHNLSKTIFLCQSFDFQYLNPGIERSVRIPLGWNVFMPVINWVSVLEEEEKGREEDIMRLAAERMDEAANLNVRINDVPISLSFNNFRIKSVSGRILLPKDNLFDMQPGVTSYVADGYWIFFKPLTSDLTIETYGSCQSGAIQVSSKYRVISEAK